jgi:hypothetical protein
MQKIPIERLGFFILEQHISISFHDSSRYSLQSVIARYEAISSCFITRNDRISVAIGARQQHFEFFRDFKNPFNQ